MKIETINKGSEAEAFAFQEFLSFTSSGDCFSFLIQDDGAITDEAYFYVKDMEEYIIFDLFYGIEGCIETYEELSDDFLDKSLVIGRDPERGMPLLVTTEVGSFSRRIRLYGHSHFFETSNSDCNTYFICDTFSESMTILERTTLP